MKCTNCGADLSPLNIQCKIDRCEYCYEGWERKKTMEDRVKDLETRIALYEKFLKAITTKKVIVTGGTLFPSREIAYVSLWDSYKEKYPEWPWGEDESP